MSEYEYQFNENGSFVLKDINNDKIVSSFDPSGTIAILLDTNEGILLKHGSAEKVLEKFYIYRQSLRNVPYWEDKPDHLKVLEIPIAHLKSEKVRSEINTCLSTSGRAASLIKNLEVIFEEQKLSA